MKTDREHLSNLYHSGFLALCSGPEEAVAAGVKGGQPIGVTDEPDFHADE